LEVEDFPLFSIGTGSRMGEIVIFYFLGFPVASGLRIAHGS
jgi:hypothetical protein